MKTMNQFLTLALLSLFSFASIAEVNFQGFASFVGGATLDKDDSYRDAVQDANEDQIDDAVDYYENKLEFDKDSLFALQASSDLGDGLSITGQIIARGIENYKPEFEWMYLSYNLTPTLNAKMGRIRTPFYMFSEYLEVGYTYHWIRPPYELYAAQVTNMDGVSFLYNMPIGSIDSQYQIVVGAREGFSEDPSTSKSDYKPLIGANAQFEMGNYVAKLIYTQGNIDFNSTSLDKATATFTADPTFQAKHASILDSEVIFAGAALDMTFNSLRILLEYSFIDFEDVIFAGDETRTLASLAYTLGNNVIHYSISGNKKEGNEDLVNELNPATANTDLGGGITMAFVAGATAAGINSDVTTHTIGLRHDFHDSAAAKVEIISSEDADKDTEATLLRFGVDMLF